jgi:alkylated DNA nucleotide flippase Atl1
LDELPDDVAGIEKLRSRPVGGAVIAGAGYATQGASNVATTLANFLDEEYHTLQGNSRRRLLARGARFVLSGQGMAGGSRTFGFFAGATYLAGGDFLGAAIVGGVGVGVNQVLRPEFLRQFGAGAAQAARIQKVVGQNISAGRRYGESSFLRGAIDLEKQATELQKKVVRVPGKPLTAAEQAMVDQANMLVDDATKLRSMHASGLEDALRNTGRVAWEDGVVAGLTGGVIASLNDSDAFGAGVGMGMGASGVMKAANRAYQLFPKPAEPVYARSVIGEVATIVAESKDPAQRGYILEFLAKAGDDEAAQIQRAGIIRDLHMSTRGRVKFVKSGEFEAATILTASPEAEARIIMAEAQALHPGDEVKAKAYSKQRQAQLAEARAATNRVTSLTDDSNTNKARILQMKQSLQGMDRQIAEQQKIVDAEGVDWKDTKTVDANRIKLDRMLQARSELEANLKVADDQQLLIDGDLSEAKGKAKVEAPMRPYEQRALPDGSTVRSASNAFYIVDGPQGKNVYVNIDTVDNIGAISEGWHALLSDSAVESLMPEMVNMMWGNQAGGTRMAVKPEVTQAILDAYMADMSPEQAAKYKADLDAGKKLYYDTKGKDTSGLVEPTREAMTWILSAMDLDKRVGYRPGLSTREGAAASVDGRSWATVKKTLFGDRTLGDNVEKGLKNLLDPAWGLFARGHAENVLGQLQQAGMRFVESGDGTLRGYFFNSNNEIIRSPVLDKFYDKVISLTGGKGSLRVRPVNLYDPLIPLDQRIEFIKRNGMDWALNEKGDGILPPLEAAQKADGFARAIEDTLNGVPEDQRGMQVYTDAGRTVRTGIPSPAELAAIAADPRIPATYKENLLTIMRTLGSGESKAVLSAEYSNVFSMNVDNVTEHRLRIGKDIAGKTETRNIIPLAFTMGEAPIYDAKGKKVRVPGPDGKMMDATQRVIRVHGFDINAFTNSKNHAFQQGLFVLDDAGKRTYLKDPKGNQYTAAYINELFGSEANFMNKATLWMQRYYAHGPLDPNSPTPRQPNGSPREVNPVSAEVLNPLDPEKGAAMRDALRAIFGLESGKKRLGWVTENRTTNTANGMLTRGTNFPLTDFRLDQFGPLKANGQSMFIDQIGVTSGQYVMSLKGWGSTKIQPIAGQAGAVMRTIVEVGDGKFLPGHELSVTEVRTHPTLPDVKLFIGTTTIAGSKPLKTLAYTLGDGRIVEASTSNEATALKELRKKLIEREDAAYIDTILGEWRYNRDKPLEGTLAPKVESKGEVKMYEPVGTAQDFVSTLEGLYRVNGRDMPPSVRAIISEVGLDAAVASGDSAEKIIAKMVTYADNRKNFSSTGDKYRHALGVLKEAQDMVKQKSYGQRAAYNVPTRTLSMDSIRDTFGLTKERGTAQANIDNRLADGFFEVSKQFAPDQFTNNKQYLEAVIDKLQEQMNAAENLESVDAYKAEKARIEPLMDAADRALGKLKNQMPELWAEQPKAGGKPAVEGSNPIERFESALKQRNLRILRYRDNPSGFEESGGMVDNGRRLPTLVIGDTKVGFTSAGMELVNNVVQIMDDADVDASGNVIYTIDRISTPSDKRGKGSASKALSEITSAADKAGLTIQLEPTVMRSLVGGGESLNNAQLVEWYKKNGFVPKFDGSDKILIRSPKETTPAQTTTAPETIAAEAGQPAGRDIQPRAGEAPDAPYLPPEEVARIREFRVAPDGTITRVTEKQKSEYDRWRQRYEAIIKKRQQEAKAAATAAERERRIFFAEQNRRAQIEIDSEEQFAAQSRKRAQEIAARDAKEAARLQKEADQAQARADALRLNFERGMDAARAAADIKRVETNRLIEVALSSEQPLIAPGLLLVESNRLTVQPVRMAVATDTVRTPSVTTRTGILYLKNLAGFEGQTQGHQQAFFNYLFAEQIGKGKAIATEAFRGPMAAQQGINLLNSRVWVAQNSGARLVRLYKNADKAAGKDLVTYKVYGANGMLIKQANDAQDAVEAIENLERRFINTVKQPLGPLREEDIGGVMNQITTAYLTQPASGRPRGNMPEKESKAMQVENFQRYLPAQPRR